MAASSPTSWQLYKRLTAAASRSFRSKSGSTHATPEEGSSTPSSSSSDQGESTTSGFVFVYLKWLHKLRWVTIPLVIGLVVAGVFGLINVFNVTDDDFAIPPGTRSYENQEKYNRWYAPIPSHTTPSPTPSPTPPPQPTQPPLRYTPSETMLIQRLDGTSLLDDNLLYNVTRYVYDKWPAPEYLLTSYIAYKENGDLLKAEVLISGNHSATMMQVWFEESLSGQVRQLEHEMVEGLYNEFGSDIIFAGFTGTYTNDIEAKVMTEQEVLHSDAIVIPVSFVLLALVVRSWRMILIPLVSIVVTASFSAGLLDDKHR